MSDDHDDTAEATVDEEEPDEETVEAERARHEERADETPTDAEERARLADAREQENPDDHRDEAPNES